MPQQDWFSDNAPKSGGGDWFASNAPQQTDTRSLWQKAKDNFNANTQGSKPGDGAIKSFIENVGAGGGDIVRALAHPLDTAATILTTPDPSLQYFFGDRQKLEQDAKNAPNLARTIGQVGTGAILGEGAGKLVAPVANAVKTGAGKALLLGKTPEAAYESALKPSPALYSQAQRDAFVKTAIDNGIPVSKGGFEKLGDLIDDYNQKIQAEIASDPNRPIDPNAVATRADQAKAKFAKQVNAGGDLKAIEDSKQQFLSEQGATQGNPAPPMRAADAQEMKQGTYRVLSGKFGEQGSASVEAQKALARGLKEEIAKEFPEIANLNAAESKLLDLQPVLERAVNRISNHQVIGIGTPAAAAATKAITGSGGLAAVASTLKAVLDNNMVKSRLAIAVSKSANIPIAQAAARVQAYSSALGAATAVSGARGSQGYSTGDNPSQPTTPQP